MEDEHFFDDFCYKDLSGIKKFNFKKAKAAKIPENTSSPLNNGSRNECSGLNTTHIISSSQNCSVQSKSKVSTKKTSGLNTTHIISSSQNCSVQKNEDMSNKLFPEIPICNNNLATASTAKITRCLAEKFTCKRKGINDISLGLPSKANILSNEGKTDTILDSLYKRTISNKKTIDSFEAHKPLQKLAMNRKEVIDTFSGLKPFEELSLDPKQSDNKPKTIKESPSLTPQHVKLTSKDTFNISKYFNNEKKAVSSKTNDLRLTPFNNEKKVFFSKTNDLAPCLTPFKKLLKPKIEPKIYTSISDEEQKFSNKLDIPSDLTQGTKNILECSKPSTVISTLNSTSPDSSIILKPKKFVFKNTPLVSSNNLMSILGKNNFDSSVIKIEEKTRKSVTSSSINSVSRSDCVSRTNLCSSLNEGDLKLGDVDYNKITKSNDFNIITSEIKSESRNNLNLDNVEKKVFTSQSSSVSSSQSLDITNDDYMDDEEFERRFGSLAEKFDETDLNTKETNLSSSRIPQESRINNSQNLDDHNTEELLKEISGINWDDNGFEDEPLQVGFKDRDDDSAEFIGNYEHTEVMLEMLHQKFGLRLFRPHQREVINASLKQHDCFVLMPTGGGKSLCYQLPAILMPGVTVVISPLKALICDQVDKLKALDVAAAHLCSDVSKAECEQIYMKLSMREPTIKLLYLTPEKISASRVIIDILESLYHRGKLARFVLDEVHCLSQWGHDFRPDYKQLSMLRKNYKDVPIICLTATATKQVEQDVINILGLKKVKRFIRSFNRPNIKYQVIPKYGKGSTEEVANLIKSKFPKMSGIVYCLSRQDCDKLAETFNKLGIKSKPYHAGMNDKVREAIQREWMQDRFYVIVATIAFGMGIDKPDVRFVIHNSIPKSVEGFYQESGRAGRDGEISYSYLFYSYNDVTRLLKIMQFDKNSNKKSLDAHKDGLNQMVSFAENLVDCRRHLQLLHLGEHFDRRICARNKATICDNCENIDNYKTLEVTKEAKELCTLVKDLTSSENVTLLYVADIYKGSKLKKILDRHHNEHPQYGKGAAMDKNDIQRVLKELLLKHILNEFFVCTGDFPAIYIKTGPKFYQFFNSDTKMHISVCINKQRKREALKLDTATINGDNPMKINNAKIDVSKPSTSGVVRHTVQKQNTAKLQAARKVQLSQLKVQCHEELLEECRRLAMERNLTLSSIMNLSAIKTMSDTLPNSKEEMLKIQHVTNANYNKYGEAFLNICQRFRVKHDALLPLTVVSSRLPDENNIDMSEDECQDDFYHSSSQEKSSSYSKNRGVKRKGTEWGAKKGGANKKRKVSRKKKRKASPTKAVKSSGWKGKGGGKLRLMPLHVK